MSSYAAKMDPIFNVCALMYLVFLLPANANLLEAALSSKYSVMDNNRSILKQFKEPQLHQAIPTSQTSTNGSYIDDESSKFNSSNMLPVYNLNKETMSMHLYQRKKNRTGSFKGTVHVTGNPRSRDENAINESTNSQQMHMRWKRNVHCHGPHCNICPWRSEMLFDSSRLPFRIRTRVCVASVPVGFENLVCSPVIVSMLFRSRHCQDADTNDCSMSAPVSVGCYAAYKYI